MNPHTSNPYMFILKADPGRYINTPAAAIVALIKAAEGVFAVFISIRMVGYMKMLLSRAAGKMPLELIRFLLPEEITKILLPGAIPDGGMIGKVLCWVTAASIFVLLICMAVEAVAALLLRFAMQGAKLFEVTHRVLFIDSIVLLVSTVLSCIPLALSLKESGIQIYKVLLSGGESLLGPLRPLIVTVAFILLLVLWVSYHRGVVKVLTAIEFEIRLEFKETAIGEIHVSRDAFLLGILFLAAGAAAGFLVGWVTAVVAAALVLAVKYFAVYSCWGDFRRCHR